MRLLIFLISLLITVTAARADSLTTTADRLAFVQAESSLARGNIFNFRLLSSQLQQYVLYPYLQYAAITQQLDLTAQPQVDNFLQTYADTPLAARLRIDWLFSLAVKQQWQCYLKYYQPTTDTTLQCYYAQALWQTQQKNQALKLLPDLWLSANDVPDACMPIFKIGQASGALTTDLVWQRVQLELKNKKSLDKNLLTLLPTVLQVPAKLWQIVRDKPSLVTDPALFAINDNYTHTILLDSIQHFAVQKPQQVAALWPALQSEYNFSEQDKQIITRAIAIELARSADPDALNWLAQVKPLYVNNLVKIWRIRAALALQNWILVRYFIAQLPVAESQQSIWQYWYARALAQTDQLTQAQTIYQQLAQQVNYYGLLASQQLRNHYQPVINNDAQVNLAQITIIPAIQRAYELYSLHMINDARREWQWATKTMDPSQLRTAAQLAMQWNWYDRALMTAAKAGDYDFAVRFPVAYRAQVISSAQQQNLDPAWVLAIMRQESAFMPDAKSRVGALGLMQLMPRTARLLSTNIGNLGILNANNNITLGSRYLNHLDSEFDNNQTIATAAYNIGPTRLQKWLPLYKKLPADIWVDILPWQETRNYVRTVTLATAIYRQQLREI